MNIAVIGSREFKDKNFVFQTLSGFFDNQLSYGNISSDYVLVSGGAKGVDSWGEEFWKKHSGECIIFKPEWDKYGKSAGFIRNKLIIEKSNRIIAFWNGISKGTKHSIDLAISMDKPVDIYVRN
ncbi:MAG: DUF2493 domain-containing protein [Novosphingobium sp.]|nr:DUF2493 domain-containing protein [Novosphingobium sp.]